MEINMFTIYDSVMEVYHQPHFFLNEGMALRNFGDLANDANSSISKHPEHYSLWHLGSFEDATAKVTKLKSKVCIAHANEHVIQFDKLKTA
jgi:hypothetical protein